jgi:hypothetical protein
MGPLLLSAYFSKPGKNIKSDPKCDPPAGRRIRGGMLNNPLLTKINKKPARSEDRFGKTGRRPRTGIITKMFIF